MKTVVDGRGLVSSQGPDEFIVDVPMTLNGALSRLTVSTAVVTTNVTVSSAVTFVDASSGNLQMTLPNALTSSGSMYVLKKVDASGFTVTIVGALDQTIDGEVSQIITSQWVTITVVATAGAWYII